MKITNFRPLTASLLALLLAAAPIALMAQPPADKPGSGHGRGFGPGGPGGRMGAMFETLDLSEAQRYEMRALFEKQRAEIEPTAQALEEARRTLEDQIHAAAFDEAAVRLASAGVANLQSDLAVVRALGAQAMRSILTSEQQVELDRLRELRQEVRESFGGRRGRRR